MARREQKKLAQRLRRANFRSQKTLECFDFDRLLGLNRALVHDLATGRFVEEKVAAPTTCRTLQYTVNAEGKREQQNVKACQAADGAWELT